MKTYVTFSGIVGAEWVDLEATPRRACYLDRLVVDRPDGFEVAKLRAGEILVQFEPPVPASAFAPTVRDGVELPRVLLSANVTVQLRVRRRVDGVGRFGGRLHVDVVR